MKGAYKIGETVWFACNFHGIPPIEVIIIRERTDPDKYVVQAINGDEEFEAWAFELKGKKNGND